MEKPNETGGAILRALTQHGFVRPDFYFLAGSGYGLAVIEIVRALHLSSPATSRVKARCITNGGQSNMATTVIVASQLGVMRFRPTLQLFAPELVERFNRVHHVLANRPLTSDQPASLTGLYRGYNRYPARAQEQRASQGLVADTIARAKLDITTIAHPLLLFFAAALIRQTFLRPTNPSRPDATNCTGPGRQTYSAHRTTSSSKIVVTKTLIYVRI